MWNKLIIGLTFSCGAWAQSCVSVPVPFSDWEFADPQSNPGGAVSADGNAVFIYAVPTNAPQDQAAELYSFNPATGLARALTQGTRVADDGFGGTTRFPRNFSGTSLDGRFLFESSSATSSFPNTPQGQVETLVGVFGPAEIIDVVSGVRRPVGGLRNRPLNTNQVYVATFGTYFGGADAIALTESIITVQNVLINGSNQLQVVSRDATLASVIDVITGLTATRPGTDILAKLNAAIGVPFNFADLRVSLDGNIASFNSDIAFDVAGRPRVSNLPGNISRISFLNYAFLNLENRIVRLGDPDLSRPRTGGSSAILSRNIGRTGKVFAYDRGVNWIGQVPNPTFQAVPAFVRLGENTRYIVPPLAEIPERGIFTNNLAYISRDERRVFFSHTSDLVVGNNPGKSYELYSFEIASGRIRQISNFQDGLFQRLGAQTLRAVSDSTGSHQNQFHGASDDGRIVAFTRGGFVITRVVTRSANGQITISNGSENVPSSVFHQLVQCN